MSVTTPGPEARKATPTVDPSAGSGRWRAGFIAVLMVGIVMAFNREHARGWPESLLAGLGAGVAGLIGWWVYHLISRRDDALVPFFVLPIIPFAPPRQALDIQQPLVLTAALGLTGAAIGAIVGSWVRIWPRLRRGRRR